MRDKNVSRKFHGVCKLTGSIGPFINSHIIPEALTRPSVSGKPLIQHGRGSASVRRWTSWYDTQLVTAEGEKFLSEIDHWAIAELRRHRLVWSGWKGESSVGPHYKTIFNHIGAREVGGIDTMRLRLFFHSLLWRAAASEMKEFAEIFVPAADLETLRQTILGKVVPPLDFYPIQLTQLSTRGVIHNQTPVTDIKFVPNPLLPHGQPIAIPIFRFYLDGLIAHIHRATPSGYSSLALGNLVLGADSSILMPTVTYENSVQRQEVASVLGGAEAL